MNIRLILLAFFALGFSLPGGICQKNVVKEPPADLFQGQKISFEKRLDRIAFGSCDNQKQKQYFWYAIKDNNPDLWIWLGDIIYGDSEDMSVLEKKYKKQKFNEHYGLLRAETSIIGIWDDHDFGVNDGDRRYPKKRESKQLLFDFLDVPKNALSRDRAGAYQSYTFGEGDQKVKVILLDCRYFRHELKPDPSGRSRYLPNEDGDILGKTQWLWLQRQLTNSDARIHIIASGIQVIPKEHGYEKWANFPKARLRLLNLINETNPSNPILITGDRHIAEISEIRLNPEQNPLVEITSSGLTHTWSDATRKEPNKYRKGPLIINRNFAQLLIDWDSEDLQATVEVRSVKNQLLYSYSFWLD